MRLTRGCRAGGGVACSSLEYGGIRAATRSTPAPHGQLLLPTSLPPPPRSLLFVHLRFPPFLSLSSPTTMLPQEHRRGPATPSCLLPRILCRFYADNSDDDDVPISLRRHYQAHCSSSKAIGKMDRRKKARGSRDGEEKHVHPLFRMMYKEDAFLLRFASASNFATTTDRYVRLINLLTKNWILNIFNVY